MTLLEDTARAIEALPEGLQLVFFSADRSAVQARERLNGGWPTWCLGSRISGGTGGLRVVPAEEAAAWPMVNGQTIHAATMGSSLGSSAALMYLYMVVDIKFSLGREAVFWQELWPREDRLPLRALHAAVGGDPALMDGLDALLEKLSRVEPPPSIREFIFEHLEALDPSPAQRLHVAAMRERQSFTFDIEAQRALYLKNCEGSGVWREHITWIAADFLDVDDPEPMAQVAWEMLHTPPQFDACSALPLAAATGIGTLENLYRAMVVVSKVKEPPAEWSDDPWTQLVYPAIRRDISGPWQLAYMEAAAEYDGREQPVLAWNMLCAGAYFVRYRGGPWRTFFDAARALAERRGWVDCLWALNDMAVRAELD